MSKITNDRLNLVWHWMLYSCTHMATVGVKGLIAVVVPSSEQFAMASLKVAVQALMSSTDLQTSSYISGDCLLGQMR